MREVVDVRFRASLRNPAGWVVFSVLGALFVALGVGAAIGALVYEERVGPRVGMLVMATLWVALGAFMLRSVLLGVSDHRSCRVHVLSVTLRSASPVKTGLSLTFDDERGRHALVPTHWRPARLPQRAELWRTARGRESLVLALYDEGRVCSVLEGPRGSEVGLRMPLGF